MRTVTVRLNGNSRTVEIPEKVQGIISVGINLDSAVAIIMLQDHGEELLPGIGKAPIICWKSGKPPDGRPLHEWIQEGFIPVNFGGWIFDHHPHEKFPGECAATRALDFVDLGGELIVQQLKEYLIWDDTRDQRFQFAMPEREACPFALGPLFKQIAAQTRLEEAFAWLRTMLTCYWSEQTEFFVQGKKAWEASWKESIDVDGHAWTICAGVTPSQKFPKYARSQYGSRADVVIHVHPCGHVQILASSRLTMDELARLVRLEEQRAWSVDSTASRADAALLMTEGEGEGWYYQRSKSQGRAAGSMLARGTQRFTDVAPTRIGGRTRKDAIMLPTPEQTRARLLTLVREWLLGPHSRPPRFRKPLSGVNGRDRLRHDAPHEQKKQ